MCICSFCICSYPRRCRCHLKHGENEKKRLRRCDGRGYRQPRDARGTALRPLRASLMLQPRSEGRARHSQPLFPVRCSQCDTAVLGEDFSCWPSPCQRESRERRRRRRAGVPVSPQGCWGSRCPRHGRKRRLTCGTRAVLRVHVGLGWVPAAGRVGRREGALAGLAAASYLSLARRERVQNLRPCSLRTAQRRSCPGRC